MALPLKCLFTEIEGKEFSFLFFLFFFVFSTQILLFLLLPVSGEEGLHALRQVWCIQVGSKISHS